MPTNLYFLWKTGGTAPSGYTKATTWNGKYLKLTNSSANHGVTGGSLTHDHPLSGFSCGGTGGDLCTAGGGSNVASDHNHGLYSASGPTNNDPSYLTYELLSIDLATWEAGIKCFPAGSILLSASSLASWNEVTRETGLDGNLIKIDTAGGSGGRTTANHNITMTTTTNSETSSSYGQGSYYGVPHNHNHTGAFTTDSQTTKPQRIQTRVYSCASNTSKAYAGVICFVDGTPSSHWDNANLSGFVEGADTDATLTGTNTNSHASGNITSSTHSDAPGTSGPDKDDGITEDHSSIGQTHNHQLTFNVASADHQPVYVQLYAVKLNTTLYAGRLMIGACLF